MTRALAPDFELLRRAVREAGALALDYFGKPIERRRKPDGTEVSAADLAANACLERHLRGGRADYGWLSEETEDDFERLGADRVWIVDPIDGTRAYLKGRREWTVSAALIEAGRPVLGVIYNPATDEWFEARAGGGASLNGEAIHVGARGQLEGAHLIGAKNQFKRDIWAEPWPLLELSWANSIAYRLALVAADKADATLSLSAKSEWDIAAADLLITEAGGRLTDHFGNAFSYNRRDTRFKSILAANPKLHGLMLARTRVARI